MPDKQSALMYVKQQMDGLGNFMQEYKALDQKDREDLRKWAEEEKAAKAA